MLFKANINKILCPVLNLALTQGNCFAFTHNNYVLIGCIHFGVVSMFPMAKEQREISVNTSTIHHFEIIFDNPDFSRLFVPFSHDTLHI